MIVFFDCKMIDILNDFDSEVDTFDKKHREIRHTDVNKNLRRRKTIF